MRFRDHSGPRSSIQPIKYHQRVSHEGHSLQRWLRGTAAAPARAGARPVCSSRKETPPHPTGEPEGCGGGCLDPALACPGRAAGRLPRGGPGVQGVNARPGSGTRDANPRHGQWRRCYLPPSRAVTGEPLPPIRSPSGPKAADAGAAPMTVSPAVANIARIRERTRMGQPFPSVDHRFLRSTRGFGSSPARCADRRSHLRVADRRQQERRPFDVDTGGRGDHIRAKPGGRTARPHASAASAATSENLMSAR